MIDYQRNITYKLFLIRLILSTGLVLLIYFLLKGILFAGGAVAVFLLIISLIKIDKLSIRNSNWTVERFHFFALSTKKYQSENNPEIKAELFTNDDIDYAPGSDTVLDFVILLIPFFYIKKGAAIIEKNEAIRIRLNANEFGLMDKILNLARDRHVKIEKY